MKVLLTALTFGAISTTCQAREVPFSTNEAKVCKDDCIDAGHSFCPLSNYGLCCEEENCGMADCSHENTNIGARYLSCI